MFTEMWSSVWWPWPLVWTLAAAGLVALLGVGALELRRRRRWTGLDVTARICVYLDQQAVMNLYRTGRYTEALTQEVEQRNSTTRSIGAEGPLPRLTISGNFQRGEERVRTYVQQERPMDVIGVLVQTLRKVDGIVHADLRTMTVENAQPPARALTTAGRRFGKQPAEARLSDIDDYVLLRGVFRMSDPPEPEADTTVFLAPYGPAGAPGPAATVRVGCDTAGLIGGPARHRIVNGYCLGTVKEWNAAAGTLEVRAVAIFD